MPEKVNYYSEDNERKQELVLKESDLIEKAKLLFSKNRRMFDFYTNKIAGCKSLEEMYSVKNN